MSDPPAVSDSTVRIWCPQLIVEESWQHITLVLAKSGMLKNSSVTLYLNGACVATRKVSTAADWGCALSENLTPCVFSFATKHCIL